ncbi:hypothetical protein APHAL10511_001791 [Amanita phalloides]|nr:hypothetical protein APHAL10511_001791 [Amanita phalloides]
MPRFNILRALAGVHAEKPAPEQGDKDILNTRQLPSRKTRTLTKRRPMGGREQSEPSYNVRTEDIGYHELGRYPKATPDSMPMQSNPPQYADDHPQLEGTKLEYPTMTHDSFHPMSQSSKRWSPVPYVYREPATEQYDDDGTTEHDSSHHESPHMHEPPRHTPRDARRPQSRKRIEAVGHNDIPVSQDAPGSPGPSRHEGRENLAQNAHLENRHSIRYIHDSTMNSDFPHQSSPMLSPADITGRERSINDTTHTREESVQGSDIVEPVIFEHEVLRDDGAPNPKIWHYIVPGGLDVIFKDEDGNELTRIKNVGDGSRRRVTPMVIEDEFGNEIYRTGHFDPLSSSSRFDPGRRRKEYPYESQYQKSTQQPGVPGSEPVVRAPVWVQRRSGSPTRHVYTSYLSPKAEKVILIDEHGRQIPIADRRKRSSTKQAKRTQDE